MAAISCSSLMISACWSAPSRSVASLVFSISAARRSFSAMVAMRSTSFASITSLKPTTFKKQSCLANSSRVKASPHVSQEIRTKGQSSRRCSRHLSNEKNSSRHSGQNLSFFGQSYFMCSISFSIVNSVQVASALGTWAAGWTSFSGLASAMMRMTSWEGQQCSSQLCVSSILVNWRLINF
jgi:hypothetical protein